MANNITGGCLCKAYSYEFDQSAAVSAHHCHCTDCQKITGSGKATLVIVPTAQLSTEGELKSYTVTGTDGTEVTRSFCPNCGSQVLSNVDAMPAVTFIKAGTLNDSSWVRISSSFWSNSAQPWSPVDPGVASFEQNPDPL